MTEPPVDVFGDDTPKEECGVVGVYAPGSEAARLAFFGLFALQHRGQESAGIAASNGVEVAMYKDMGLVTQIFQDDSIFTTTLVGELAIGHTRYSTTGASVLRNAQPMFCQSVVGEIAVAHNGNLVNAVELRAELEAEGEVFDSTNDSEVMARLIVRNMSLGLGPAIRAAMERIKGAYSVTVLTRDCVAAFRDPHGFRPMSVGRLDAGGWMVASETCAFGPLGAIFECELLPGEIALLSKEGLTVEPGVEPQKTSTCLFEFIYFARPDSIMAGTTLYLARERMGRNLAIEHPADADVVIPVPDSGIPAAIGYAKASGLPFAEGMMKSRYIHRTFIQPDPRMRERGVRMKLSPIVEQIRGKRLVLVDDSIVRGTTTKQIVKILFDSGAKEVHVRITAPPIKFPCFYGIDMASKGELIAAVKTHEEICQSIGATSLGYLSVPGAVRAVREDGEGFCLACFTGNYPLPVPENLTKEAFEFPPDVGNFASATHTPS